MHDASADCFECLFINAEDNSHDIDADEGFPEALTQSEPGLGAAAKRRRRSRWDVDGKACLTQTSRHGDAGDDYFGAPSAESAGDASGGEKSFGKRVNQTSFARFASGFANFSSLSTSQQAASAYDDDSKATPMASPADAAALATTASKSIATMPSLFTPSSTTPGSPLTSLNDAVCKRVYVGNLCYRMTELEVRALFSLFGTVCRVSMPLDVKLGRHRGFAFVDFDDAAAAEAALRVDGLLVAER